MIPVFAIVGCTALVDVHCEGLVAEPGLLRGGHAVRAEVRAHAARAGPHSRVEVARAEDVGARLDVDAGPAAQEEVLALLGMLGVVVQGAGILPAPVADAVGHPVGAVPISVAVARPPRHGASAAVLPEAGDGLAARLGRQARQDDQIGGGVHSIMVARL